MPLNITSEQIDHFLTVLYYIIEILFNFGMQAAAMADGQPIPEYYSPIKEWQGEQAASPTDD